VTTFPDSTPGDVDPGGPPDDVASLGMTFLRD